MTYRYSFVFILFNSCIKFFSRHVQINNARKYKESLSFEGRNLQKHKSTLKNQPERGELPPQLYTTADLMDILLWFVE